MPSEAAHAYDFRPVAPADLARLRAWLAEPHVARWWGDAATGVARIAAHTAPTDPVDPFIVLIDGKPAGYIQAYDPHKEPDHPYRDQPPGTMGIDITIGEPDLVGKGHGPRIIDAFVKRLFAAGASRIVIDPDPANANAVKAYRKAGFRILGRRETTEYGPALMMARDAPDQTRQP